MNRGQSLSIKLAGQLNICKTIIGFKLNAALQAIYFKQRKNCL